MPSYLDVGYDPFLSKLDVNTAIASTALDPLAYEDFAPESSASKVQGGILRSNDGKLLIDLENDTFIVNDGLIEKLRLGILPDGRIGLLIKDKDGNILMQISEGLNIIKASNSTFEIDIDNKRILIRNSGGTPIGVFGDV